MNQVNFNSDKLVIVCYPRLAGGKFLINSLGLSTKAVLQDSNLATQDINGLLSQQDKFDILNSRLVNMSETHWTDLNLGCFQLFGNYYKPSDPIPVLSSSDYHFFIVAHTYNQFSEIYKHWPNAKIIAFTNSQKFIEYREIHLKRNRQWQLIRSSSWPNNPPTTIDELKLLDADIQQEINKEFPGFLSWLVHRPIRIPDSSTKLSTIPNASYYWDNNLYFSKIDTVNEIKKLYNYLKLPDFNQDLVSKLYDSWMYSLSKQI